MTTFKVKCPACGSDDVRVWYSQPVAYMALTVEDDGKGAYVDSEDEVNHEADIEGPDEIRCRQCDHVTDTDDAGARAWKGDAKEGA